ncbi:MAG: hypothetical protein ACRCYQ_02935 [Nocardioides sp.]
MRTIPLPKFPTATFARRSRLPRVPFGSVPHRDADLTRVLHDLKVAGVRGR